MWKGEIGGAGEEEDDAIESGGKRGELILSHPSRGKRGEGEPEEEMEIRPEDGGGDAASGVEET